MAEARISDEIQQLMDAKNTGAIADILAEEGAFGNRRLTEEELSDYFATTHALAVWLVQHSTYEEALDHLEVGTVDDEDVSVGLALYGDPTSIEKWLQRQLEECGYDLSRNDYKTLVKPFLAAAPKRGPGVVRAVVRGLCSYLWENASQYREEFDVLFAKTEE